jgi:hypothetical protein
MPWLMLNGWMTVASARADLRESSPQLGRPISTTVWLSRWSSNVARAHAVLVRVLSPAEILIAAAARRSTTHPAVVAASCITRTCGNCAATSSSRRPHRRLGYPQPLVRRVPCQNSHTASDLASSPLVRLLSGTH